jgi:flavin reductase (DIM6/NTAB) family NADH-FMN oxidoreductase RutF
MDLDTKKTVLRMIPYGLYVLTSGSEGGNSAAATVNWVTQVSFEPPLVVVAVKVNSHIYNVINEKRAFGLNILGKDHGDLAFTFFKHAEIIGGTIGGQPFHYGVTGVPILENVPAFAECNLVDALEHGDHAVFLGEIVNIGQTQELQGRPDEAILKLKDLGDRIYYGG